MHEYRVSKYDPEFRRADGAYLRNEWTAFSDIGKEYGGVVLTAEEYRRVEKAYVDVAIGFLREAAKKWLKVVGLEDGELTRAAFTEGAMLDLETLASATARVLREEFWCRFEGDECFLHFGYDYYMYVGVPHACESSVAFAERQGLFVEAFASPYK